MASAETEALECDSYSTTSGDAQAGESKLDDTTMAEAFECNPYGTGAVGPVDGQAVGSVHDGIIMETENLDLDPYARVSVDAAEVQASGSEHDSSIVGFGETEALECGLYATASVDTVDLQACGSTHDSIIASAEREALECDRVTIASVDTVNLQEGGSEHEGTVAEREALECDPYGTASVDTVDVQSGGSEQDVTMTALAETAALECYPYATTAVDFRVSVEEGNVTTSPRAQNVLQEATNLVSGDDEVSVTVLDSITHLETAVTPSMSMVSNQEGSLSSACPAVKTEDDKFEEVIVQNPEESQEEHAYDIGDFDIGAHEVPMTETFFGKHCMLPALDADKSEAWEAAGNAVIMEDNSLEHDGDRQENVDTKSISIETNSTVVVNHDLGEKVLTEEQGAHNTQLQLSSESVPMDAIHRVEESRGSETITLQASHVLGHVSLDGFQCDESDIGNSQGLASRVVKGEKLLYNDPEDVGAQDINLQCDADNIFASFPGENTEIVHAAGSYETRSSEDSFDTNNGVLGVENEAVHYRKFDQELPGISSALGVANTNSDTVSNDEELQRELQTTVVGSRMEAYKRHEEGATQAEIGVCEQSEEVGKDAVLNEKDLNVYSGAAFTSSQSLNLAGNTEPMSVPVNGEQEENASNVTHDKAMLNNNESEVAQMVSDMEVDTLHKEQVEKQGDDLLLMGGKSVDEFEDTVLDRRQSDGEVILDDRDAVSEDKVAGPEQENEAIIGQEQLCLGQPVDTCPPLAEIAIQAAGQDLSTNLIISSSEPGDDVSSCTDLTQRNKISEGLNDREEPALRGLEPCEESREKKHRGSSEDAGTFSKVEKPIGDHKSPSAKGLKKLESSIIEAKQSCGERSGMETNDDSSSSEHEEELPDRKLPKPLKEGNVFGIGDLVWAKVRSHPWWPAQIFDPADASKSARKAKKSGRVLVAFFGDCTFAWLQQSQMIAFRLNFKEKVKQTTMRIFCIAVEEALEEVCRRSELGLSCTHFKGSLHSTSSFPDANAGIREGVRVKRHEDIRTSVQMFRPDKTLEFVKGVACCPLGEWSSTVRLSELRGHVYGLRTCMVASGSLDAAPLLPIIRMVPSQGSKLKRSYSSLKTEVAEGNGKEAKRLNSGKDKRASEGKGPSQISKRLKTAIAGAAAETVGWGSDVESQSVVRNSLNASDGSRDRLSIKFKVSKKIEGDHLSNFERLSDTAAGQEVVSERSSDDGGETLLAFAGKSAKVLNRSKEDTDFGSIKKKVRRQTGGKLQNRGNIATKVSLAGGAPDGEAAASTRTETYTDGAFTVSSSLSEERVSSAQVTKGKGKKKLANVARSSVSSIDAENLLQGTQQAKHSKLLNVGSKDEVKKAKLSETLEEVEMKKDVSGNDNDAGKKEAVRKLSKMGDSIRKVAGELTGTPVAKCVDDSLTKSTGPGAKKKMKDLALELQASPTSKKAASEESTEDVSLLQLRQDLELLANKAGSRGGTGKAVKHSKKVDQVEPVATKSSPHWQNAPHRSQRSCVQELALAARKRKSEIAHDEVLAKLPKTSSTARSERRHTSKTYISSAEKPVERRSFDKSLLHYSRRPAPSASTGKSSSQRYDEKLSSHMPLGLFMRFPADFPLPSESQLKATFIPFGPLQMSATRLYKDTASAQVVFKHGRDAESALKHAKKNAMFGQVAVTYRLRYLSHSSRVETKTDAPSPSKANSSSIAPGKKSFLSKEKGGSPNASSEAGDNTSPSSRAQDATHSESELTGDIQDQMMTLLRQVSVIVNTSP